MTKKLIIMAFSLLCFSCSLFNNGDAKKYKVLLSRNESQLPPPRTLQDLFVHEYNSMPVACLVALLRIPEEVRLQTEQLTSQQNPPPDNSNSPTYADFWEEEVVVEKILYASREDYQELTEVAFYTSGCSYTLEVEPEENAGLDSCKERWDNGWPVAGEHAIYFLGISAKNGGFVQTWRLPLSSNDIVDLSSLPNEPAASATLEEFQQMLGR